jgi:hypothetical protein
MSVTTDYPARFAFTALFANFPDRMRIVLSMVLSFQMLFLIRTEYSQFMASHHFVLSEPLMVCRNVESVIAVLAESAVAAFSAVYMTLNAFLSASRIGLQCAAGARLWRLCFCLPGTLFHTL